MVAGDRAAGAAEAERASVQPKRSAHVCSPRMSAALPLAPVAAHEIVVCGVARESCAAAHAMFLSTTHRAVARLTWLPSRPEGRGSRRRA